MNYLLRDAPFAPGWLHDPPRPPRLRLAGRGVLYLYEDFPYEEEKIENWVFVARIGFVSEEDAREFAEAHRASRPAGRT